jgi:RpiR family carbohydrate utilization transcriptional regulator
VVEKIFDKHDHKTRLGGHHIDLRSLEDAVALLENATAIEFFGFGASAIVASDAQQKFPSLALPAARKATRTSRS